MRTLAELCALALIVVLAVLLRRSERRARVASLELIRRVGLETAHQLLAPDDRGRRRARSRDRRDPGKQVLDMLRRGDDCDWYSLKRTDSDMHEDFDCLEIYWRTQVERRDKSQGWGRGPFEEKAGFRVRWHVAAAHAGHVEAYGLDLMSTILAARELADKYIARVRFAEKLNGKHPLLEAWKAGVDGREYRFHGLRLDEWTVVLEYPNGHAAATHEDLDEAARLALSRAPTIERKI